MKRFLFGFLAVLFLILNTIPYLHILADDMPTNSQYEMLGAYALSTLITSGEATELDFSDYTENDTSFLIDLGEAIFTGDWSGLAEDGLVWLGDTADNIYDSYKEYVSQWKSDHLGIMYSNWFPDETIYVGPDDSYSLAKPLRELFTPRDNDTPDPAPPPDFSFLENNVDLLWGNTNTYIWESGYNIRGAATSNPTLQSYNYNPSNSSAYISDGNAHLSNQTVTKIEWSSIVSIYITDLGGNNNVTVSYDGFNYNFLTSGEWYISEISGFSLGSGFLNYNNGNWTNRPNYRPTFQTSFAGLSTCVNYINTHFAHVNIYYNGDPWVIVSNNEPTYPIVIPGQLTIYNNQPLEYTFPPDTHIDLTDLTNIIRNAINSSGVVMWSDIADTYVDVNGQTAVAVTKIIRNDYDNLYNEQYPYPAMLVGMTDQTKFNEHLLDNSHAYLSPMGTVVQETVDVLPSELVGVLAIGAILTIFAVIINRLLE